MNGVELARNIAENQPHTRMLVVSSHDQFDYVKSTLKSGASDYILKHELNQETFTAASASIVMQLEQEREREREEERAATEQRGSYAPLLRQFVREQVLGYRPVVKQWMTSYPYTGQRSVLLVVQIASFSD
jgi:two-component system response regulator YesN